MCSQGGELTGLEIFSIVPWGRTPGWGDLELCWGQSPSEEKSSLGGQ